ncbi:LamG domain-containing protein [Planctomycetota bacterium]
MFAADSVGDNDAIVLGGIEWQPTGGQINGALQLDGVSGYAIAGAVLNPADGLFSIFAWIKGGAPGQVVVSQQSASNWLTTDAVGKLMTELKSSDPLAEPLVSETVITDGQWHRIGLVWDDSHRILYVDSIIVAEDTQDSLEGSENGLNIGAGNKTQPGTFFSGLIDDVRIYNHVENP